MSRAVNVLELYDRDYAPKMIARADGFRFMLEHLEQTPHITPVIIETGTATEKSDGQSTLVWDFWLKHRAGRGISIDVSETTCRESVNRVERVFVYCIDSVHFLGRQDVFNYTQNCYLLYLDGSDLDVDNPVPSNLHHLMELAAVWAMLPSGCLVVVETGKHIFVQEFMEHIGIKPVLDGYQRGWIKP